MLPAGSRLTRSSDFRTCVRRGARGGSRTLTVHLAMDGRPGAQDHGARVGLVVSKAVGNAVARNRVARQLRHLMGERIDRLPAGTLIVIRAQAAAYPCPSAQLAEDLDQALSTALKRSTTRVGS